MLEVDALLLDERLWFVDPPLLEAMLVEVPDALPPLEVAPGPSHTWAVVLQTWPAGQSALVAQLK